MSDTNQNVAISRLSMHANSQYSQLRFDNSSHINGGYQRDDPTRSSIHYHTASQSQEMTKLMSFDHTDQAVPIRRIDGYSQANYRYAHNASSRQTSPSPSHNRHSNFQLYPPGSHPINRPSIDLRNLVPEMSPVLYKGPSTMNTMPFWRQSSNRSFEETPIPYVLDRHSPENNETIRYSTRPEEVTTIRYSEKTTPSPGYTAYHTIDSRQAQSHATLSEALVSSNVTRSTYRPNTVKTPSVAPPPQQTSRPTPSAPKKCSPMMSLMIRAKLVLQEIPDYDEPAPKIICNPVPRPIYRSSLKKSRPVATSFSYVAPKVGLKESDDQHVMAKAKLKLSFSDQVKTRSYEVGSNIEECLDETIDYVEFDEEPPSISSSISFEIPPAEGLAETTVLRSERAPAELVTSPQERQMTRQTEPETSSPHPATPPTLNSSQQVATPLPFISSLPSFLISSPETHPEEPTDASSSSLSEEILTDDITLSDTSSDAEFVEPVKDHKPAESVIQAREVVASPIHLVRNSDSSRPTYVPLPVQPKLQQTVTRAYVEQPKRTIIYRHPPLSGEPPQYHSIPLAMPAGEDWSTQVFKLSTDNHGFRTNGRLHGMKSNAQLIDVPPQEDDISSNRSEDSDNDNTFARKGATDKTGLPVHYRKRTDPSIISKQDKEIFPQIIKVSHIEGTNSTTSNELACGNGTYVERVRRQPNRPVVADSSNASSCSSTKGEATTKHFVTTYENWGSTNSQMKFKPEIRSSRASGHSIEECGHLRNQTARLPTNDSGVTTNDGLAQASVTSIVSNGRTSNSQSGVTVVYSGPSSVMKEIHRQDETEKKKRRRREKVKSVSKHDELSTIDKVRNFMWGTRLA